MKLYKIIILMVLILLITTNAYALNVFPGAEGYGTNWSIQDWVDTTPDIYLVDTLEFSRANSECVGVDDPFDCCTGSGAGTCTDPEEIEDNTTWKKYRASFKEAWGASGAKIILFEIGGYVDLIETWTGDSYGVKLEDGYAIVAGQTAPSPGIAIKGSTLSVMGSYVLMQHIATRTGDHDGSSCCDHPSNCNGVWVLDNPDLADVDIYNIVIDHCSMTWSVDKNLGVWDRVYNFTASNNILAEALRTAQQDPVRCSHVTTMTTLLTGDNAQPNSFIKNLMMSNMQRFPLFDDSGNRGKWYFANNVIYNFAQLASQLDDESAHRTDIINNVYLYGDDLWTAGRQPFYVQDSVYPSGTNSQYYLYGNSLSDRTASEDNDPPADQWTLVQYAAGAKGEAYLKSATPLLTPPSGFTPLAESVVEASVVANAGAYKRYRADVAGDVDSLLLADLAAGTGQIPITVPSYPTMTKTRAALTLPSSPYGDNDSDGYTNIEEWLHDLATYVQTGSVNPQNVSPNDNDTGVSITASASWYNSAFVDSVDLWLDTGACDGTPDGAADLDDSAITSYDMSTLTVSSTYCLTIRNNYESTTGDYNQYEFITASGPPVDPQVQNFSKSVYYKESAAESKYCAECSESKYVP